MQKEDERPHARFELIVIPWIADRPHAACDRARPDGGKWPKLSLGARLRSPIGALFGAGRRAQSARRRGRRIGRGDSTPRRADTIPYLMG